MEPKPDLESPALLSVRDIWKSFGQNDVLKGINFELREGEVAALIGGNGAGKSTLMKIIMGIYQHDRGDVFVSGQKIPVLRPSIMLEKGVYLIPQEPLLFPNMTVEANVAVSFKENGKALHRRLVELLEWLGWNIDLSRMANSLSIAEQQMVEILRGLMRDAKILILDEPTSSLTFNEVNSLFKTLESLKQNNIGIIYITHRLAEVFEIATQVAIMRDGVITLNNPVKDVTEEDLLRGLLPQGAQESKSERAAAQLDYGAVKPVLEVKNLCGYAFSDVSFSVYPGEILGLAGLVGAGRTELAVSIFGRDSVLSGKVLLQGEDITGLKTSQVIGKGINYVPEDRYLNGAFRISDVAANTTSACFNGLSRFFVNFKKVREITAKYVKEFNIRVTGQDQAMGALSGGNQQKVILGRILATSPKVIILDEPTRGIDAVARGEVYNIILGLRDAGVAVLLISSDLEEIMELSDRIITMFQGRINCTFEKGSVVQDNLIAASFGI